MDMDIFTKKIPINIRLINMLFLRVFNGANISF